jgi:hypothetical protein
LVSAAEAAEEMGKHEILRVQLIYFHGGEISLHEPAERHCRRKASAGLRLIAWPHFEISAEGPTARPDMRCPIHG